MMYLYIYIYIYIYILVGDRWWLGTQLDDDFPFFLGRRWTSDFHSIIFQRGRWLNHQPAGIGTLGVDPQVWSRMNYLEVTFEKPWSDVGNFIIPTDFHSIIFQRGWNHQPDTCFSNITWYIPWSDWYNSIWIVIQWEMGMGQNLLLPYFGE